MTAELMSTIRKVLAPVERRVMNFVCRGIIRAADDAGGIQRLQIERIQGEVRGNLDRIQEYGFTSVPLDGAEAVVIFISGNQDHGIVIATDDRRSRLRELAAGDAAMWNAAGAKLVLKNATKNLEAKIGKLKIENDSDELVTVLSDLCGWLSSAQVVGNIPFLPAQLVTLAAIKTRLDSFKS